MQTAPSHLLYRQMPVTMRPSSPSCATFSASPRVAKRATADTGNTDSSAARTCGWQDGGDGGWQDGEGQEGEGQDGGRLACRGVRASLRGTQLSSAMQPPRPPLECPCGLSYRNQQEASRLPWPMVVRILHGTPVP